MNVRERHSVDANKRQHARQVELPLKAEKVVAVGTLWRHGGAVDRHRQRPFGERHAVAPAMRGVQAAPGGQSREINTGEGTSAESHGHCRMRVRQPGVRRGIRRDRDRVDHDPPVGFLDADCARCEVIHTVARFEHLSRGPCADERVGDRDRGVAEMPAIQPQHRCDDDDHGSCDRRQSPAVRQDGFQNADLPGLSASSSDGNFVSRSVTGPSTVAPAHRNRFRFSWHFLRHS